MVTSRLPRWAVWIASYALQPALLAAHQIRPITSYMHDALCSLTLTTNLVQNSCLSLVLPAGLASVYLVELWSPTLSSSRARAPFAQLSKVVSKLLIAHTSTRRSSCFLAIGFSIWNGFPLALHSFPRTPLPRTPSQAFLFILGWFLCQHWDWELPLEEWTNELLPAVLFGTNLNRGIQWTCDLEVFKLVIQY